MSAQAKIKALLQNDCCKAYSPAEIAEATGLSLRLVHLRLKQLPDVIERVGYGRYRWQEKKCTSCQKLQITGGFIEGHCLETGERFCHTFGSDWQRMGETPKGPRATDKKGENEK